MKQQQEERIDFENALAIAMLKEILEKQEIKTILLSIANELRSKVLSQVEEIMKDNSFINLTPAMKGVFRSWAIKHSRNDAPLGALLPDKSQDDLENTPQGRRDLLAAIAKNLDIKNPEWIDSIHKILSLIKTMDDIGYFYCSEAMPQSKRSQSYETIKNMLYPTPEELGFRKLRKETTLAITYGIGTQINKDLIVENEKQQGCFSGKACHSVLSTKEKIQNLIAQFDAAVSNNDEKAKIFLEKELGTYGIPLDKTQRKPIGDYITRYSPWFEKLAKIEGTDSSLPLIASTSASTARLLITILDLGLFIEQDGIFNLNKAQKLINCLFAYFCFCGNHSLIEVTEIWNRLLDYLGFNCKTQLPKTFFNSKPGNRPYIETAEAEQAMPYARVGGYSFHKDYRTTVLNRAETLAKAIAQGVCDLGMFSNNFNCGTDNSVTRNQMENK